MDIVEKLRVWERGACMRPAIYDEAADEIEHLRGELDAAEQHVKILRAERDALRKDAERYRWLRKNACYIWRNRAVRAGDQEEDVAIWIKPHVQIKDEAIDAAIDAALRGKE